MKKSALLTGLAALLVLAAGIGGYLYMTAPTKGPSEPATNAPTPPATSGQTPYVIVTERSVATFTLDELLRGQPVTVVGTSTGAISGDIGLDKQNPYASTLGTIKLNARTFVTDNEGRNNMIRRSILKTEDDANEFITFKATKITGPDTDVPGIYDITGDLTIAGVTKPATFRAQMNIAADGTLTARATTTVKRADFGLVIPSLPFLANIEEEVDLALNIVAQPKP